MLCASANAVSHFSCARASANGKMLKAKIVPTEGAIIFLKPQEQKLSRRDSAAAGQRIRKEKSKGRTLCVAFASLRLCVRFCFFAIHGPQLIVPYKGKWFLLVFIFRSFSRIGFSIR
jgi:hypothetical protein